MTTVKIIGSFILFCVFCINQVVSQGCVRPLGMADGRIKDSQITTSSVLKERSPYGRQARLNQNIEPWGAWCPDISGGKKNEKNYDQYIEIDLLNLTKITGIATQGRELSGGREYVRDYKISYRRDGGVWNFYQEKDQTVKIFQGNTNVSSVVRHNLDPAIMAGYIRVHPGYYTGNTVCMRLELYGCVPVIRKDILSYSMPVGQTIKNGKVTFNDTSYNGVLENNIFKDGTGILTDGKFGSDDVKQDDGKGWVGWTTSLTTSQYIDIEFEFSGVRKFKDVTLTVNVDKKRSNAVFKKSEIFFASKENDFSNTSFLQYCPGKSVDSNDPYSRNISLSLCENTAKFIKLRLYFGGRWLLLTEISFNSVPVSKDDEKTRLQNCSCNSCYSSSQISPFKSKAMSTTASPTSTPRTNIRKKCACKEAANSIAIFFVGVAVTLFVVLVVFVSIWFYIRRRQTPKLSTGVLKVDTIEMQNETPLESSPNNQERDRGGPINSETTTYEEVPNSPPFVYAELNRNQKNENTNDNAYQKLMKPDSDYAIPAEDHSHEEVGKKRSPPGYKELDQTKREDADVSYQKLVKK